LSRRHAHVFVKGEQAYIEDLGSTNGTFVDGKRLDEHAVPLEDGHSVGFGGHHFVYEVTLQKEEAGAEPTVTKFSAPAQSVAQAPDADAADKTTFVAAADSFLDIFCVDQAAPQEDEAGGEQSKQADDAGKKTDKRRPRSKFGLTLSQMREAFSGGERKGPRRMLWAGAALMAVLAAAAFMLYVKGEPERELGDMLARRPTGIWSATLTMRNSRP
jgi:hypothetical protein